MQFIDIGGVFGIPYQSTQAPLKVNDLGQQISNCFRQFCEKYGKRLDLMVSKREK
ncbi:MAG: hypothetical protein HQM14_11265 [SAR324 cluster bacterium]|nr:hypothetical protein [SAR324 cluster bacterium]